MPMTAVPAPTAVIGPDECLRLLAGEAVGRVVFTTAAMPAAQPVAFVIDRGDIVFRAHGPLGAARKDVVAFEADNIDPHTLTGWSVLGVGETYEIRDPARLAELVDLPVALPGTVSRSTAVIAIKLRDLTGRRVQPTDPPPGEPAGHGAARPPGQPPSARDHGQVGDPGPVGPVR